MRPADTASSRPHTEGGNTGAGLRLMSSTPPLSSRAAFLFRRLFQRAAAARSLPGGAAVAVTGDADRAAGEIVIDQLRQMHALASAAFDRQVEQLVEVAIVDIAAIVERDQVATHHAVEVIVAVRLAQEPEVVVELALGDEHRAEPLDRHVGERVQAVEHDAVALAEHALVVGLEGELVGWQRRSLRIVDEVELEPGLLASIAERVEALEAADRAVEHALAALPVHVVEQV